jgi:hypothetical protein
MKKHSIIIHTVFFLIILAVVSVSYAGERARVIEMADGHSIVFPMTPEDTAAHEGTRDQSEWFKPAKPMGPDKSGLVFEMGESGITVSFPLTVKETAALNVKNFERVVPPRTKFHQPKRGAAKFELSESGNYIIFPARRDEIDQIHHHYYGHNPR